MRKTIYYFIPAIASYHSVIFYVDSFIQDVINPFMLSVVATYDAR